MMNNPEEVSERANGLMALIKPILAGNDPEVISWTLAELTAMNIAGHIIQYDGVRQDKETEELRADVLNIFMEAVRKLIPVIDSMPHFQELEEQELQKQKVTRQ